MALPIIQITTHGTDAEARLPGWLVNATNYKAFLDVLVAPYQDIEDLLISLLDGHSISTAVGVQLDVVGRILDLTRTSAGESDTSYRTRLAGRAAELSASGEVETLITVWSEIWQAVKVIYVEHQPATFEVTAELPADPGDPDQDQAADDALRRAKGGGIGMIGTVGVTPLFLWGDADEADANGDLPDNDNGWGDAFDTTPLGVWTKIGGNTPIANSAKPALAALNSSDVAFVDSGNDKLRTYRFNDSTGLWVQVGNDKNISGLGAPALAALSSNAVALVDASTKLLGYYIFDGSDWTLVGTEFDLPSIGGCALAALNSTDVVFIDLTLKDLRTLRFNGSTWSQVGSILNITGVGTPGLAKLNATDIAFIDSTNRQMRTYRFNGSTWSKVGNSLDISGAMATLTLTSLNNTDVVFIDDDNADLRLYRFDGSDWLPVGADLNIAGMAFYQALAALNGGEVAFITNNNDVLQNYRHTTAGDIPAGVGGGNFARIIT